MDDDNIDTSCSSEVSEHPEFSGGEGILSNANSCVTMFGFRMQEDTCALYDSTNMRKESVSNEAALLTDNLEHREFANSSDQQIVKSTIQKESKFDLQKFFDDKWHQKSFNSADDLRRILYDQLAQSDMLKKQCSKLLKAFIAYMEVKMVPSNGASIDILWLLVHGKGTTLEFQYKKTKLPKITLKKVCVPLFPELRLKANNNSKWNKNRIRDVAVPLEPSQEIDVQHIVIFQLPDSFSSGSNSTSSSDSNDEEEPLQKKFKQKTKGEFYKVCQRAKNINVDSHLNNVVIDLDVYCQVDMLILIDTKEQSIGVDVAKHLGLISVENLFGKAMKLLKFGSNPDAKMYKLLQTLIAGKLMDGYSNILITSMVAVWHHVCANVRGIITDGTTRLKSYERDADYFLVLKSDVLQRYLTLSCIEGISEIINRSLGFKISLPVSYEVPCKKFCTVNFPITSIIPLYIIRYFTQIHKLQVPEKFDDLFED